MNQRQQKILLAKTQGNLVKETFYDYTGGREKHGELVVMVGVSGSGKSTYVKSHVGWGKGDIVRVNRDDLRKLIYAAPNGGVVPWSAHKDQLIRPLEIEMVKVMLRQNKTVYVDDTNCVQKTLASWTQLAITERVKLRILEMTTPLQTCIERQKTRPEGEEVPKDAVLRQYSDLEKTKDAMGQEETCRAVLERQELLAGRWVPRLPGAKWVFVDIDGTVADHTGVRNQYDESRVIHDNPYPVVVAWVRELYKTNNVCIFSGRKDRCCDDTCDWLEMQGVPFDHILMRPRADNRKDAYVKKELLDSFMTIFKPEDVFLILDDRPQVVRMWRNESEFPDARHNYGRLPVIPVRGAVEEF